MAFGPHHFSTVSLRRGWYPRWGNSGCGVKTRQLTKFPTATRTMASRHSYTITLSNNKTEKEAIEYLLASDSRFLLPDKESKLILLRKLALPEKYIRTFDLIMVNSYTKNVSHIELLPEDEITLIELKTTKKKLTRFPKGFFFGATQSEFDLAAKLGNTYKFCFVSLHDETKAYYLMTLDEMQNFIVSKRIQYQINF